MTQYTSTAGDRPGLSTRPGIRVVGASGLVSLLLGLTAFCWSIGANAGAAAPVVQVENNPTYGSILTTSAGKTLYTLSTDHNGQSTCTGSCLALWPALTVSAGTTPTGGAGVTGMLGASLQSNGTLQVTYNGSPLYTFVGDMAPGQVTGQGVTGFSVAVVSAISTTSTTGTSAVATVSVPWPPGNPNNGQTVTVTGSGFPARSTGLTLEILECADPGGSQASLPTDPNSCDGTTASPLPIYTDASGNFNAQYTIGTLSTSGGAASNIDCNMTSFCVLWVGVNYLYAFGQPGQSAFSAPFEVGSPPAAAPEAPVSLLVPFVGGSVAAAALVLGRRRAAAKAKSTI